MRLKPAAQKGVIGQIDGLFGQGLSGWVCRQERLEDRLWVELVADGTSLGIARAEHFHRNAAHLGDGFFGFWIPIPPVLLDTSTEIVVRIANTGETFAPAMHLGSSAPAATQLSHVFHDMSLRLSGWVMDAGNASRIVTVSAWLKGKCIARAVAENRRFEPFSSDGHGFEMTLPLELADGEPHNVIVRDDRNIPLPGSPVIVQTLPEKLSTWLQGSRITKENQKLLEHVLARYEEWLPRSMGFDCYPHWKKSFSPDPPVAITAGIAVCPADITYKELLRAASKNTALVLLSEGSELLPQALEHLALAASSSGAALVYADSELSTAEGIEPLCKPAWDPWLFGGHDYLGPVLIQSSIIKKAGLQQKDLSLALRTRLILAASQKGVCHLPLIVSSSNGQSAQPAERLARRTILEEWLSTHYGSVNVVEHPEWNNLNQLRFLLKGTPLVSIIIPTRDRADLLQVCLDSLWKVTTYTNVEILIIDNGSVEPETKRLFRSIQKKGVRVLPYPDHFNYAAMNNMAAREARGEVLCFLNNDTEVLTPDWLQEMLALLLLPDVGCVGAKLLWPNGLVQHGGVVVGTHQLAAHVGNGWPSDSQGYLNRNLLIQQWSAVTAACLLTHKALFIDCGGFDAKNFSISFNDVDYCLRLRKQGYKVLWTPHAQLMHHESASRGKDNTPADEARTAVEMHHFRQRWGRYNDPFYNPNLTLSVVSEPFDGLALPPRKREIRL